MPKQQKILTLLMRRIKRCFAEDLVDFDVANRVETACWAIGGIPSIETIGDILPINFTAIETNPQDQEHIEKRLGWFGFVCGPHITWIPERTITAEIQELLESSWDALGVDPDIVPAIEKHTGLIRVEDYLREFTWKDMVKWAGDPKEGGIKGFGDKSLSQLHRALVSHGFLAACAGWYQEADVPIVLRQQLSKVIKAYPDAEPFARKMVPDLFEPL